LQPEFTAENGLNLVGEAWLIQVSFLENPHGQPAVAVPQPPEGEPDENCPCENAKPENSALPQ
jgi:hypothetical protein